MLEEEVKLLIIDVVHLEDITPEDIDADAPLFGDGLGLDSIDALELGIALQQRYGITLPADALEMQSWFVSVRALAVRIAMHREQ